MNFGESICTKCAVIFLTLKWREFFNDNENQCIKDHSSNLKLTPFEDWFLSKCTENNLIEKKVIYPLSVLHGLDKIISKSRDFFQNDLFVARILTVNLNQEETIKKHNIDEIFEDSPIASTSSHNQETSSYSYDNFIYKHKLMKVVKYHFFYLFYSNFFRVIKH